MHQGQSHLRRKKAKRTLIKYRQIEGIDSTAAEKRITQLAPTLGD
jgi:hypothetical protein